MNIFKISWKSLLSRPLNTGLSLVLVALGVGLSSLLLLLNQQMEERLYKNIEGINMVVGAKGSPLQMILSSVYHIDVPTGNIPLAKVRWMKKNPYIEAAIPLALGDSYEGFRIVGTDEQLGQHYNVQLAEGKLFSQDLEVTLGAKVAQKLGLKIGDTFFGAHGLESESIHIHENAAYTVVGIFEANQTVLDQLILTNVASVWRVHESHDHEHEEGEEHSHEGHDHGEAEHNHEEHEHSHEGHDHGEAEHNHEEHEHSHEGHEHTAALAPISEEGKEITAVLIRYAKDSEGKTSAMASTMLPKIIDETEGLEELGYAVPAFELRRLMDNMGMGAQLLYYLAAIIIIISALSMFISLYNSIKERKYELALMRSMGASAGQLLVMLLLEGILVALFGALFGLLISHLGMGVLAGYIEETYRYSVDPWRILAGETWLFFAVLGLGILASIIPAIQAYSQDISKTLSEN
ncbi:ABC-type transport system, involved in lipoprotein release, permease component [Saprospira grandis DSM 2844]|uniref:ABC-type transport system, involved in lipoprotein release, permease component n=1 Tax=Saprospira grandis DSM 2844 TaxID=694433 RepID=J1I6Q1_9BACT|nr:FtsX-like permease family protein [Saprospira grandis]EJF54485.1 ABC-type transport system, involved in lipoprotein release, permease component [Saprospira grandis DSM 2844]